MRFGLTGAMFVLASAVAGNALAQEKPPSGAPSGASTPVPSVAPSPVAPPLPPAPSPTKVDWVVVTLSSDDPRAGVYAKDKKVGIGNEVVDGWSFVCQAPCGEPVDPHRTYRVMGESILPSIEFHVAPGAGQIALDVHSRHPPASGVTAAFATTAGVGVLGGVLLLVVDLAEHGAANAIGSVAPGSKKQVLHTANTFGDIGLGLLAGGVVFGTVTLVYAFSGGHTDLVPSGSTTKHTSGSGIRPIPGGFAF